MLNLSIMINIYIYTFRLKRLEKMGKYSGKKCRLLTMMVMTTFFFLVEIVFGYVTNSMALVADSFHMLADIAALLIAYLSLEMSPKKWSKNTFGMFCV